MKVHHAFIADMEAFARLEAYAANILPTWKPFARLEAYAANTFCIIKVVRRTPILQALRTGFIFKILYRF